MRASNYFLNAMEIYLAAGLNKYNRDQRFGQLRRRGVLVRNGRTSWVPFKDGVFLCQAVGLVDDMKTLFSYAPVAPPPEEENYLTRRKKWRLPEGYRIFMWN